MSELLFLMRNTWGEKKTHLVLLHSFVPTLYKESFFSPEQLGPSAALSLFWAGGWTTDRLKSFPTSTVSWLCEDWTVTDLSKWIHTCFPNLTDGLSRTPFFKKNVHHKHRVRWGHLKTHMNGKMGFWKQICKGKDGPLTTMTFSSLHITYRASDWLGLILTIGLHPP